MSVDLLFKVVKDITFGDRLLKNGPDLVGGRFFIVSQDAVDRLLVEMRASSRHDIFASNRLGSFNGLFLKPFTILLLQSKTDGRVRPQRTSSRKLWIERHVVTG